MRVTRPLFAAALCTAFAAASPALAQTGPVIVVPGKPGVPVIINGVVADGAIVYGDWGLAKPNNAGLMIVDPVGYAASYDSRGYYPATGRAPRYGRLEGEPKGKRRPANTDFQRQWSAGSNPGVPVTEYPPFDPPPVMLAPRDRRR